MKISNNLIASLALIFIVISLFNTWLILKEAKEVAIVGKIATSQVHICMNREPRLLPVENQTAIVDFPFKLQINFTDGDCKSYSLYVEPGYEIIDNNTLQNLSIKNIAEFLVFIDNIGVSWSSPEGINITRINISDIVVWIGSQPSGSVLDIADYRFKGNKSERVALTFNKPIEDRSINITFFSEDRAYKKFFLRFNNSKIDYVDVRKYCEQYHRFYSEIKPYNITEIDPETGIIEFTPKEGMEGNYNVSITLTDDSGCPNNVSSIKFNLTVILIHPPTIISYYPLNDTIINESENITFNITYIDLDEDNLTIRWYVDDVLVKEEFDPYVRLKSYYEFITNYTSAGTYNVTVHVSDGIFTVGHSWILEVKNVNRPPYFNRTIEDLTWNEDTSLVGPDLDYYVYDPDIDDTLSFDVIYLNEPHVIDVYIDPETHIVFLSQLPNWYGVERIKFVVMDNWGAMNESNVVTLTVINIPEEIPPPVTGGGGGGGISYRCIENWYCTRWGPCLPEGYRYRKCYDLNECGTNKSKPPEKEECTYIPTCYDGLCNQGELCETCKLKPGLECPYDSKGRLIPDCGGPCPPCFTCYDGIQNQGELGVDCGGPCPPCPNCSDGVKNQGELGVDCGGPCPNQDCCTNGYRDWYLGETGVDCGGPCKPCEMPAPPIERVVYTVMLIVIIILIIILVIIYRISRPYFGLILMKFKSRMKEKEKPIMRVNIQAEILAKLREIELKIGETTIKELTDELYKLFRGFIKKVLNIKYEFTHQELVAELKKRREISQLLKGVILSLSWSLEQKRYGQKVGIYELWALINEMKELIILITKSESEDKEKVGPEGKKGLGKSQKVFFLTAKAYSYLRKKNFKRVERLYNKILKLYKDLPNKEKEKTYATIKRLHDLIIYSYKKDRKIKKGGVVLFLFIFLFLFYFIKPQIIGLSIVDLEIDSKPIIEEIPPILGEVGTPIIYKVNAYDPDGDKLYFSDDFDLFNITENGVIIFLPKKMDVGIHQGHVYVINEKLDMVSAPVKIVIKNKND